MKRALFVLAMAVAAIVVLLMFLFDSQTGTNTLILDEAQTTPLPTASGIAAPSEHPAAPADARTAVVTKLADGDSFDIRWSDSGADDELRLVGINAPETAACFGDAASRVLEELTTDTELIVETVGRDEFGRALANVWVNDVFVNARMVESGAALALSGDGSHSRLLVDAQQTASDRRIGLWDPASCGAGDDATLAIVDIFSDAAGPDNEFPNGEWIEIGNDGSAAADLTGWSIRDESTRHRYSFPDGFSIEPGTSVQVFSGCGDDDATSLYWCDGDPIWNNGGDTGFLVDPEGKFVDTFGYGG